MRIDISNNIDLLTLEYLSNNTFYNRPTKQSNLVSKTDKKFYKKRIINETKKMLKNEFDNDKLKDIFNTYIFSLITHFKAIDTHDLMQKSYDSSNDIDKNVLGAELDIKGTDGDDENDNIKLSKQTINADYLFGKEQKKSITLDNFIIKTNNTYKKNVEFPEKKEINLNEPELKNKGIKNKKKKTILNV